MTKTPSRNASESPRDPSRSALAILHKLTSTGDKAVRLEILNSLITAGDPCADSVLLRTLDDPCQKIGALIVTELGKSETLDFSFLFNKLKSSSWFVKKRILQIFGRQKNRIAVRHIAKIIQEPNAEVRRTATLALAQIGGEEAVSVLVRLAQDSNPFVRKSAEKAIQETSRLKFT